MFQTIDDWLFDKVFQPLADWSVTHLGKNCFWWSANLFVPVAIIDFINVVERINRKTAEGDYGIGYIAFDSIFIVLWIIGLMFWTYISTTKINTEEDTQTANKHRADYFVFRSIMNFLTAFLFVLTVSSILSGNSLDFWEFSKRVSDFFLFIGMYMFACEIRPPARETELKPVFHDI